MHALNLYAGPAARRHIERHGLAPAHVGVIPAAAGGPKGLILGPLDRFIFGQWLPQSAQTVNLVGASIGAWRMATACMDDPATHFQALETGYIHGDMTAPPGRKLPLPSQVSATFAQNLRDMFEGHVPTILRHPRYRLHVVTSHGRHVLGREGRLRTAAGYLGAALTNAASRRAMGAWIERVVFSGPAGRVGERCAAAFRHTRLPHAARAAHAGQLLSRAAGQRLDPLRAAGGARHSGRAARRVLGRRHHRLPPAPGLPRYIFNSCWRLSCKRWRHKRP